MLIAHIRKVYFGSVALEQEASVSSKGLCGAFGPGWDGEAGQGMFLGRQLGDRIGMERCAIQSHSGA